MESKKMFRVYIQDSAYKGHQGTKLDFLFEDVSYAGALGFISGHFASFGCVYDPAATGYLEKMIYSIHLEQDSTHTYHVIANISLCTTPQP